MSSSRSPRAAPGRVHPATGPLAATILLALTAACGGRGGGAAPERAFAEIFPAAGSFLLQSPDSAPIGRVAGLQVTGAGLVVVDEIQSNLKLYDRRGRFLRSIGRAGDGPGEFRAPFAAAALPDGGLAVLDRGRMDVTLLDAGGGYRAGWHVSAIAPGGLFALDGGRELLVPAMSVTDGKDPRLASPHGMHVYALDGRHLRSFRPLPRERAGESAFSTLMAGVVGHVAVSVPKSRNEVHHHDLRTGREWTVAVAPGAYRPPAWPRRRQRRSPEEVFRWADRQMWVMGVVPLDSAHYAVQLTTYPDRRTVHRYAIADTSGRTLAVTDTTSFDLRTVHAGTVYGVRWDEAGNVVLGAFRLRLRGPPS